MIGSGSLTRWGTGVLPNLGEKLVVVQLGGLMAFVPDFFS
jgi:hypothetical protein